MECALFLDIPCLLPPLPCFLRRLLPRDLREDFDLLPLPLGDLLFLPLLDLLPLRFPLRRFRRLPCLERLPCFRFECRLPLDFLLLRLPDFLPSLPLVRLLLFDLFDALVSDRLSGLTLSLLAFGLPLMSGLFADRLDFLLLLLLDLPPLRLLLCPFLLRLRLLLDLLLSLDSDRLSGLIVPSGDFS